jgi:ATP phosphoribosyltransferase
MKKLKLGLPKGSLQQATIDLFNRAGWKINLADRSYFPAIDDEKVSCTMCRAQEMSRYIESGVLDAGITGKDWILENNSKVVVVTNLEYSKTSTRPTRWVLAVPSNSNIKKMEELKDKKIATELVNFTKRYFKEKGIKVYTEFSWGATEAKVASGLAHAIVEVTETGATIFAHGLKIIEELMVSYPQLIANPKVWKDPWKREKIEQIALLLKGALKAQHMVGLKMNVSKKHLETIINILPSLNAPTVSPLHQHDWYAVESMIAVKEVRDLIPKLIKQGAEGIIEYPLYKVI